MRECQGGSQGCPGGACETLAHLRPPQRAPPHKMAAGAGSAQARGARVGPDSGATPINHLTGRAMGGANFGPRPPTAPVMERAGGRPRSHHPSSSAGTGHTHEVPVRAHETACVTSHPYLSSPGSWRERGFSAAPQWYDNQRGC